MGVNSVKFQNYYFTDIGTNYFLVSFDALSINLGETAVSTNVLTVVLAIIIVYISLLGAFITPYWLVGNGLFIRSQINHRTLVALSSNNFLSYCTWYEELL